MKPITLGALARLCAASYLAALSLPALAQDPPPLPESAIYKVKKNKSGSTESMQTSSSESTSSQSIEKPVTTQPLVSDSRSRVQDPPRQQQRESSTSVPTVEHTTITSGASSSTSQGDPQWDGPAGRHRALTDRVLSRKIGSEKFQQLLSDIERGDHGAKGASTSSVWYDGGRPRTGADTVTGGTGTRFFESSAVVDTRGGYNRTTVEAARSNVDKYGSQGGGIVLEGVGSGLGRLDQVRYDTRFNAFIVDEHAVYFMQVPPKTVAVICRSIARDEKERLGVSLGAKIQLLYGEGLKRSFSDSDLAWDLKMADHFLGDIVFAGKDWSAGYRFANGFTPVTDQGPEWRGCVYFVFSASDFQIHDDEIKLAQSDLRVTLVPLSDKRADDGGFLPDENAINRGGIPTTYEQNAEHLGSNIGYYRRERIVGRMFAYTEVAAFIRALKKAGFDLEDLAAHIPGS